MDDPPLPPELEWLKAWIRSRLSPGTIAAFTEDAPAAAPATPLLLTPVPPLAAAGVIVAAVVVFGYIGYKIATTPVVQPTSGAPCGTLTGQGLAAATTPQSITVRAIGGHRSWNQAIELAQSVCAAKYGSACAGNCVTGKCQPNASVQTFDQSWGGFWTRTDLTFFCPCECL